jgi:hypothetical protein
MAPFIVLFLIILPRSILKSIFLSIIDQNFISLFRYLFKSYILFGDDTYFKIFQLHYDSVMSHLRQGPFIFHANMHQPNVIHRRHLDSLQMFWPGLQVQRSTAHHTTPHTTPHHATPRHATPHHTTPHHTTPHHTTPHHTTPHHTTPHHTTCRLLSDTKRVAFTHVRSPLITAHQVLHGDLGNAKEMHLMHFELARRYGFSPEGYTTEFKVHWGNWPLRPEFIESTCVAL